MPANLPYPLQFDPSQLKNPYTKWAGQALPFDLSEIGASGEFGGTAPTDAFGNPIGSYTDANNTAQAAYQQQLAAYQQQQAAQPAAQPGTTLNSTGANGPNFANGAYSPNYLSSLDPATQAALQAGTPVPLASLGNGSDAQGLGMLLGMPSSDFAMPGQQAAAAPAAPQPPAQPNMTQAYLSALQNPGKVTTPGANVPEAAPPSTQSNVLQAFLANWNGGKGAGNYDNSPVLAALRGNV